MQITAVYLGVAFLATQPSWAEVYHEQIYNGSLAAGEGKSFTLQLPPMPALAAKMGEVHYYDVEVSTPLPSVPLRKSDRPHIFALAFSLDARRQLRRSPSTDSELIWSTVKLRNCSTDKGSSRVSSSTSSSGDSSSSDDDGALRFRVPADPMKPTTIHVLLASNYLGSSGSSSSSSGGVPFRVLVQSPHGERRAPVLLKHPTGLTGDEATADHNFESKHSNRVSTHRSGSSISSCGSSVEAASLPRRILCVDGGGSKGVIPLESLAELERRTGVRTRDQFDFFAGTSTGSIVAAGLALADLPVSVLTRLYVDLSAVIFGSRVSASQRSTRLRAIMSAVFGPNTSLQASANAAQAHDMHQHTKKVLAKSAGSAAAAALPSPPPKRFIAVATDASTVAFRPYVFRSFAPTLLHPLASPLHDAPSCTCNVVDALLASTAAPTFFSPANLTVDGEARTLADGALCANNPSQVALLEIAELAACATVNSQSTFGGGGGGGGGEAATREARRVPSVALVLSLGCGQPAAAASHAMTSTSSPSQWFGGVAASIASAQDFMAGLFTLMTDTDMIHEMVRRQIACQSAMQQAYSSASAGTGAGDFGGGAITYCRLNCVLDGRHMRIDESTAPGLRNMMLLSRDYLRKERAVEVAALVQRLAELHPENQILGSSAERRLTAISGSSSAVVVGRSDSSGSGSSNSGFSVGWPWFSSPSSRTAGEEGGREWAVASYGQEAEGHATLTKEGYSAMRQTGHALYAWRASRPLRAWRKSVARATGLSGFFSGKNR